MSTQYPEGRLISIEALLKELAEQVVSLSARIKTIQQQCADLDDWAREMDNRFTRHQGRPHGGPEQ